MGCSCSASIRPSKGRPIQSSAISKNVKLTCKHHSAILEAFEFVKILGHGQFGVVREAFRKSQPSQHFAIKSITKTNLSKHKYILQRELEIMSIVDHPNIIRLFDTYEDEIYLHLVLELCEGGDVCERIIEKGSFTESQAVELMRKLASAVNYLHINNITHRDLKSENFLYVTKESNEVKICDFGMSIRNKKAKMNSVAGTPYYLAPEIIRGPYTKACDVWSLGVFLYFILTGKYPFKGKNLESVYQKSAKGVSTLNIQAMSKISEPGRNLLEKMLTVKASKRITLREVLEHPWMKNEEPTQTLVPQSVLNSLMKYKAKSKLWQEAVKIVVKSLSHEQISMMSQAFVALDSSKAGFITAHDLEESMKRQGFNLALEEIEAIIRNCSYISSGKINYSDFLVATLNNKAMMNEDIMWQAFKIFDLSNTGKIRLADLDAALKRAGCEFTPEEFAELVAEAKIDENQMIDLEGFKKIMTFFEEEKEVYADGRRASLMRRMSQDFKEHIKKMKTMGKSE